MSAALPQLQLPHHIRDISQFHTFMICKSRQKTMPANAIQLWLITSTSSKLIQLHTNSLLYTPRKSSNFASNWTELTPCASMKRGSERLINYISEHIKSNLSMNSTIILETMTKNGQTFCDKKKMKNSIGIFFFVKPGLFLLK